MQAGEHGLLHASTGAGKTWAVWFGALGRAGQHSEPRTPPLGVLWITPMRALAADTVLALRQVLTEVAPHWSLGLRTSDTPSAERSRQDKRWPTVLVTTPESLSLMLTRPQARQELGRVHTVIVDEWHELLGSKRGVQVQLALARLRAWGLDQVVWGLSATLGNPQEALASLTGGRPGRLVQGGAGKPLLIDTLLPELPQRFSWSGQLGAVLRPAVVQEIEQQPGTTLVFANSRAQAELWYQALLDARPDWAGLLALHHSSLDRSVRDWVEQGLKTGQLKAVVATSSLDLGVDFPPVRRVLQIGSAKGVARLMQRAGRSGHAPGQTSRITLVPTQMHDLLEAAAARQAVAQGRIEARHSPQAPLDVLVQHLVSVALGGGFQADALFAELHGAWAYRQLSRADFDAALAFVLHGGASLGAYPEYHRVAWVADADDPAGGAYRVPDAGIARRHRMQVGTIVADAVMKVAWQSGGSLGTVDEGFIARLKPGDCFVFAGRVLEYLHSRELTAYVKKADRPRGAVAVWSGSRMALSGELAQAVRQLLYRAQAGDFAEPELQAAQALLHTQARLSALPAPGRLLLERLHSADGHHLFVYPLAGRQLHLGLASVLAWRLAQAQANTFSMAVNDLGFELLSAEPLALAPLLDGSVWRDEGLDADVYASLNASELAQRRFREIARVAGLVFAGYPGAPKGARQLQASSALFFEVFRQHDPEHLLLRQAHQEALTEDLAIAPLRDALAQLRSLRPELVELNLPSPLALPLMVDRLRERLSTETLSQRLQRMLAQADAWLDGTDATTSPPGTAVAWDAGMVADDTRPQRPPGRATPTGQRRRRRQG